MSETDGSDSEGSTSHNGPTSTPEDFVHALLEMVADKLRKFSDHHIWKDETLQLAYAITSKFHPELLDRYGTQTANTKKADSVKSSQEHGATMKALAELSKAVHSLNERIEDRSNPSTGKKTTTTPENPQGTKSVHASGPIFRPTKPSSVKPLPVTNAKPPRTPLDSHHPARLVVIFKAGPLAQDRPTEKQTVIAINDRLALHDDTRHLRVASARYNPRSNLILMMRADQTGAELKKHADKFLDVLLPPDAPHTAVELATDDRRYKVRINGIETGRHRTDGRTHSPEEILDELKVNNPVMESICPIGPPRWVKAEVELRERDYSSAVLEFLSEDDANTLLSTRSVAVFTRYCDVVIHADKAPLL
ncbi:hypothetical protein DXG03_003736, partial [Asterophora parasitica]